jgi:3-hydroxyisobutyrate dehydrogenase-like beta-hydroxyacid dehydrogenase
MLEIVKTKIEAMNGDELVFTMTIDDKDVVSVYLHSELFNAAALEELTDALHRAYETLCPTSS